MVYLAGAAVLAGEIVVYVAWTRHRRHRADPPISARSMQRLNDRTRQ